MVPNSGRDLSESVAEHSVGVFLSRVLSALDSEPNAKGGLAYPEVGDSRATDQLCTIAAHWRIGRSVTVHFDRDLYCVAQGA